MYVIKPLTGAMEREFDVIIFGATGFTGSLVAEYFARHYLHSDVKWALAGRSAEKLQVCLKRA